MNEAMRNTRHGMVALASFLAFLILWEVLVRTLNVRPIMLPPPSAVLMELHAE